MSDRIKGVGWEFGHKPGTGKNGPGGFGTAGLYLDGKKVLGSAESWEGEYEGPDDKMAAFILDALTKAGKPKD